MDILNFISWIKGGRVVTSVDSSQTLLPVGLKDPKRDDGYLAGAISVSDLTNALVPTFINQNTRLGNDALPNMINTTGNTAIGYNALSANTSNKYYNVAIGTNVATTTNSMQDVVAIGNSAFSSGSGNNSVAIGSSAAYQGSNQSENVNIGYNSGYYNQNTQTSVSIGAMSNYQSGYMLASVAVGYGSGRLQSNGNMLNTYIGPFTAFNNWSSGDYNTSLGGYSLYNVTSGFYNLGSGYNSLFSLTAGYHNTAIGAESLYYLTTGQFNTAIGTGSGSVITSGSNNTFLGREANASSNNISASIAIGRDALVTASNQISIGSAAYPAGSVNTESVASTKTWTVKINGTVQKILLA